MKKAIMSLLVICCCIVLFACQKQCEHQYQESITTEASCTTAGVKTFTCSLCQDSYTEQIAATEHSFGKAFISKSSSCIENGEKSVECTVCKKIEVVEKLDLVNHKYTSKVTTEATCISTGEKTYTCSVCNDSYKEDIAKSGHKYTSKVITAATCTSAGEKTYTCSVCNDTYNETISKTGHSYKSNVTTEATCTSAGKKTYTCSVCNYSYTETIAATGHRWSDATCTSAKKCNSCGKTEGNALGHTTSNGTCSRCGKKISIIDQCSLKFKDNIPFTMTSYNSSGSYRGKFKVEAIDYHFEKDYTTSGAVILVLKLDVYCVDAVDTWVYVYFKVYDAQGRLVASDEKWFDGADALYTTVTIRVYALKPSDFTLDFVTGL